MFREDAGGIFDLSKLPEKDGKALLSSLRSAWIGEARFFIRTNIDASVHGPRQIVVVCDHVYDNVPQPAIWNLYHRNPAHAVGYSDGSSGLISDADFKKLDLSQFTDSSRFPVSG